MSKTKLKGLSTDAKPLVMLAEVNQALTVGRTPREGLQRALEILDHDYGVIRSAVVLADANSGRLRVENSAGVPDEGRHAEWEMGEGITGRVVASGKPVVIPQISQEPAFLHRTGRRPQGARSEITFMCVPIPGARKALGSLNIDFPFERARQYDRDLHVCRVVASMFGQAIRLKEAAEVERQHLLAENTHLKAELKERYDFSQIIGTSGPMRQVYEQIAQVTGTNTTVLVRGESGTGKELHRARHPLQLPRAKKPFIKVSCAALPDSLIEAELFGHEKGAFTGAAARKKGRFELADGGTLFLDEIGDINLSTQVKLLRVLQEKEFERLGGVTPVKTNVRLIAATNADLEKAIAAGTFREDLHYRVNVFTIFYSVEHGKSVKRISTPAIDMLMAYHWPGNVRELENSIERALLVCDGSVIHGHHLPPSLQTSEATGTVTRVALSDAVGAYEKDLIQDALKTTRGNRVKAARLLDSTERIISYKVKKYEIDCRRFR
ncbi:Nitrogen fixation protein VnfA [Geodia barretti]|uniref:Nitrogen fixation protein VnfA n=1 Tax=Geodia barretti TaxID=519541 RepID=A0AA35RSB0_GEOBA|nr:Nitrogen fixation protein VnfA [Geodia barretti]